MPKHKKLSDKNVPRVQVTNLVQPAIPFGLAAGAALIVVLVFLAYFHSLRGGFILDDDLLLTDNYLIKASDGPYQFWFTAKAPEYYPVTNTMFWIEWRVWGMNPTGYRAVNLIIHIVDALLIWFILWKLSIPGAFLAAMIFAVHPVNVESVAWISQLRNVLTLFFSLLSIWCYLKAEMPTASVEMTPTRSRGGPWERVTSHQPLAPGLRPLAPVLRPLFYWLSLALFIFALLSKGSSAVLPALLLGFIWWRRGVKIRDIAGIAPSFAAAAAFTWVNIWFQTHGSGEVIQTAGFTERLLGAGGVVWFYLYKALLPLDLVFVYPQWHIQTGNPLWWLPLSAALALTAVLWCFRKGWSRPLLFAWGMFCASLLPVMGFVEVGFMKHSLVADHYQHIAIIVVIALLSAMWSVWHRRARGAAHLAANIIAVLLTAALAFLTWRQTGLYRNPIMLYEATLEKNPVCWLAHNNLGVALGKAGRIRDAIEHCKRAIELNSDCIEAYNNLGLALAKADRSGEAIEVYQQALRLKPNYPEAHNNLGLSLDQTGRPLEAIEHYEKALALKPDYPEAHNDLGLSLVHTDRPEDAIKHYEKALQLKPDYPEAYFNLGSVFAQTGRFQQAIKCFQQAIRFKPDYFEAYNNLGNALVISGRLQEAIAQYRQAIGLKPDFANYYFNLAMTYAGLHRSAESINAARKALELARSQRQTALAEQIEEWLNSYRDDQPNKPNAAPFRDPIKTPP
jgi:tetratricopeptide (TPR) repeat protein